MVFKWVEDPARLEELARVVERVERLRAKGYPAPRHHPPLPFDGGVALFQDAAEGTWRDDVDAPLIDDFLALNDLQAGEGNGSESWSQHIARTLVEGADGYCLHEPLRTHSRETSDLLSWVEGVGRSVGDLPASDLVHYDFHHRNVLRVGTCLSAVIDLDGCRPGDRIFDLVTFAFGFTHADAAADLEDRVWQRAQELGSTERLTAYIAHMSLRRVDWTIRHHSAADVARLLEVIGRYRSRFT